MLSLGSGLCYQVKLGNVDKNNKQSKKWALICFIFLIIVRV